ncbi:hypothetical protein SISSUDRAFT_1043599 [Sistotremastrum suecicum HHB10207 ss-3]|uniref:HNH nuclease domain-containing protein n=1 Tax=Sistotremastrum suecicum HHB10207 ss-3 TaxID=1314776 RepID=A0A166FP50_9AGAM|nr:hypothetical protein SISSUDRAFT_1043599 [Sistotremastrum suecicum HHB10207 ss-3]
MLFQGKLYLNDDQRNVHIWGSRLRTVEYSQTELAVLVGGCYVRPDQELSIETFYEWLLEIVKVDASSGIPPHAQESGNLVMLHLPFITTPDGTQSRVVDYLRTSGSAGAALFKSQLLDPAPDIEQVLDPDSLEQLIEGDYVLRWMAPKPEDPNQFEFFALDLSAPVIHIQNRKKSRTPTGISSPAPGIATPPVVPKQASSSKRPRRDVATRMPLATQGYIDHDSEPDRGGPESGSEYNPDPDLQPEVRGEEFRKIIRLRDLACRISGRRAPQLNRGINFDGLHSAHVLAVAHFPVAKRVFREAEQIALKNRYAPTGKDLKFDHAWNGLLLRTDIHADFDAYAFGFQRIQGPDQLTPLFRIHVFEKDGAISVQDLGMNRYLLPRDGITNQYLAAEYPGNVPDVAPEALQQHFRTGLLWHVCGAGMKISSGAIGVVKR